VDWYQCSTNSSLCVLTACVVCTIYNDVNVINVTEWWGHMMAQLVEALCDRPVHGGF